jgi:hypothetical protein
VAAAAALEKAVSRHFTPGVLALIAGLAVTGAAGAATQVVVVAGKGGEAEYEERFAKWSETVARASATATGDPQRVQRLAGKGADRAQIRAALQQAAQQLQASDQFVLVLLGHGSYDGSEYRYMIEGDDLTGTELRTLLDRIPAQQLVVNATSTSGAMADAWASPRRVVITATRSGGERNATRFGGYWADALVSEAADLDKDGNVTAKEAYDFTVRQVADSFKSDTAILTERARITGAEPARFVVARLGSAALFASDAQLTSLRAEQDRIGEQLSALRARKAEFAEDDYYTRIEPVLLELARVGVRIDARFKALGVNVEGAGDAR